MIKNFSVSIYPERITSDELKSYCLLLKEYGIKNVFISFLNYFNINENQQKEFLKKIKIIKENSFTIHADINDKTLENLRISIFNLDLSFFEKNNIDIIRFDYQMDGMLEALISKNDKGIKISINASTQTTAYIRNILAHGGNSKNLIACHNFFPQEYTGLSYDFVKKISLELKELGVKVMCFITQVNDDKAMGPEFRKVPGVIESMPTIENHRKLPIELQFNNLINCNFIDEVILSTQFATKEILDKLENAQISSRLLKLDWEKNISETEKEIMNFGKNIIREDMGEYLLRSSLSSYFFKDKVLKPRESNLQFFEKGSILIPNDKFGVYKGEIQIVKKRILNDGKRNLVGTICKEQDYIVDDINAFDSFRFI